MRTRLTLQPNQGGTKELRDQYGDRLVCVRYRYDEVKKERWQTVELIIDKRAWEPPSPQWPDDTPVALQVAASEREVRRHVKAAGGTWNPRRVVWELPYGQVVALGLTDRIVTPAEGRELDIHLPGERMQKEPLSTSREEESHLRIDGGIYIFRVLPKEEPKWPEF